MMSGSNSLFVQEDDDNEENLYDGRLPKDDSLFLNTNEALDVNVDESQQNEVSDRSRTIPVVFEEREPHHDEKRIIKCNLPLRFYQEIVEDMLSRDGLLLLGRGLGWEIIAANLLHALSTPSVKLHLDDSKVQEKKSLIILLNATEEENMKLNESLMDLRWIDACGESMNIDFLNSPPITTIVGETSNIDKRSKIYNSGGLVSVTPRILLVDILSGVVIPEKITGIFLLHAERIKETSNDCFIINLYRDRNEWGFIKAVSDDAESFVGFSPLATRLKNLRIHDVFLWPRFHLEISASLNFTGKNLISREKEELRKAHHVTEINVKLSYKMNKIQAAIMSCLNACLMELKRHNPSLATEYWDIENIHDSDFIMRIRLSLDPQWHRISWTSKQLVYDLSTLKDLLADLVTLDSLTFYQCVQEIIDQNVKSTNAGTMNISSMSPWLNLDEANTIISYARERALGKRKVSVENIADTEKEDNKSDYEHEEYILEELPKWEQLGFLLDDIIFEKMKSNSTDSPILIMCSNNRVARQLRDLISLMSESNTDDRKTINGRKYMVKLLDDYITWKEFTNLAKKLNNEFNIKKEETEQVEDETEETKEELIMSKTFSRGKGFPLSKRRRTRGAAAVANVGKLYSGTNAATNNNPVEIDEAIFEKLKSNNNEDADDDNELNENDGGFIVEDNPDDREAQIIHERDIDENFLEYVDQGDQIIIETYNSRTNDTLLQSLGPSHIIMFDPNLSFIRRIEIYQSINRYSPARVYFMYYGSSIEEQKHLQEIKREKESFTKLIKERASLAKHFETSDDNYKISVKRHEVVNTRIAGGATFRTEEDELKVVVDVREFRSSLPNLLYRAGMKVIPCMLTVGDYVISPKICIERKAVPDLISSFKSGRLYAQCEQMFRHYEVPTLLIEFDESKSFSFEPFSDTRVKKVSAANPVATKLLQQDIQSKIMMLLISFPKLKIIWSSSPYETAQILLELKSSQEEPDVTAALSKGVNTSIGIVNDEPPLYNEDAIDFIQNVPGINNLNYFEVIKRVKNIHELALLSEDDLTQMLGIENGKKVYRFLNQGVN
ncbi:Piso0_004021 [Millerozyma farinosa CBS 7064]|uniref:Piso0_004021 protein n=1 Tax=Pichia sorbitophila (strain ATCC MYA-4447 / BCRC 22081 / CBS 7064 / NBRC 10061 / NRRL Y-12695) TaxID=559304 RepID=G8Y797_PICSO|nr:Piso0_004021 [Millerozyma farinosa CBS 7064]CCE84477.1 Piso0_004021 [Millerozyma farinosa CBS 7064]